MSIKIKYFKFKQANAFTKALACFPPKLRYITSRRLWMGLRLGLYKTVLKENTIVNNRRAMGVKLIAKIKRLEYTPQEAQIALDCYLASFKNNFFHEEVVRETIYLQQEFYLKFFDRNPEFFNKKEFVIWYLSLLASQEADFDFDDLPKLWRDYIKQKAPLLYSNINNLTISDKLDILNQQLKFHNLQPISLRNVESGLGIQNLCAGIESQPSSKISKKNPKVTIIVTVFNTSETLKASIGSLLNQTWREIEVIVVNDASEDESLSILKNIALSDNRVIVVDLPRNVGTFSAKSIGARYAGGEFLTCHDSDDWAHPQKIEIQVKELIKNKNIIATTSQWVRVDVNGNYHVRQIYPYVRQNPASPLFRREKVANDIGLWHCVRTGADSEFIERLKLFYGVEKIKAVKGILTIGSYRKNSLTTSNVYGAYNDKASLIRLDYWESWRIWHLNCLYLNTKTFIPQLDMMREDNEPDIDVPDAIRVSKTDYIFNINNAKILIIQNRCK
ncbi:glycosyltransferase family 2 protein [Psychrobacter sp.]|uniref:glycosyltransferase family 2 protein n=1 Tax=Psychrobacter sp. TaxID=56811 RepID=UPI003F95CFAC